MNETKPKGYNNKGLTEKWSRRFRYFKDRHRDIKCFQNLPILGKTTSSVDFIFKINNINTDSVGEELIQMK